MPSIADLANHISALENQLNSIEMKTTLIDAQSGTPTARELLGGCIRHNSKSGGGTLTLQTGTIISSCVPGVRIGSWFDCLYVNYGNQTVTITGATGSTIVGTAAVTTAKNCLMRFVCSGTNTWYVYLVWG